MDIFLLVWRSYSTIMVFCFLLFIALYLFYLLYQKEKLGGFWSYIFIIMTIFLPLFHLYALLGFIIAIIFSNKKETYALYLRHMRSINIYFITSILFWIGIIVLSGNHKKIMHYLVGYRMVKPYSFFFFPLIILLAYQEIECLISWMNKKIEWRGNKVFYNYSMIIPFLMFS